MERNQYVFAVRNYQISAIIMQRHKNLTGNATSLRSKFSL